MKNHKSHLTCSTPFLKVNVVTHDHYTNGQTYGCGCNCVMEMVVVVILRTHLPTRSGKIMKTNMKRKKLGKITNMFKTCAIVMVAKVIGLVPFIH